MFGRLVLIEVFESDMQEVVAEWGETLITLFLRQMKHQLDATLCRFYFCRVHSTCFGHKRPSSGVFKTSTAATGTCVIVAGQSSHLLIRAGTECRIYFCRVTLHVSGVKRPSSGVFKTSTAATGTCVIVAGKSSHLLIRTLPVRVTSVQETCSLDLQIT